MKPDPEPPTDVTLVVGYLPASGEVLREAEGWRAVLDHYRQALRDCEMPKLP